MVPEWDEIKNLKISKDGVLSGSYMDNKFSLDLDRRLGNKDGNFDLEGKNFSQTSSMLRIKYPGNLSGNLKKEGGFFTNFDEIVPTIMPSKKSASPISIAHSLFVSIIVAASVPKLFS